MQPSPTDEILVQRILKGDQSAFRVLILRYQDMVFTMVLRIVGRREEAEEVAQDVFMKVYAALASFEGKSKFSSWLYRIAYNTALTKIRGQRTDTSLLDNERMANVAETKTGNAAYNDAEQIFRAEEVAEAIKMLNAEDATVISLFYMSEQSLEEIAQILNLEPNAVKVRLHRARKKLKDKMESAGWE